MPQYKGLIRVDLSKIVKMLEISRVGMLTKQFLRIIWFSLYNKPKNAVFSLQPKSKIRLD